MFGRTVLRARLGGWGVWTLGGWGVWSLGDSSRSAADDAQVRLLLDDEEVFAEIYDTNRIRFATRDEGSLYTLTTNAGTGVEGADNLRSALGMTTDVAANSGTDAVITFDGYANTINRVDWAQSTTTKTLETRISLPS